MKKYTTPKLLALTALLFGLAVTAYAAPSFQYAPTIFPIANNTYDLGSSTDKWRAIYTTDLTVTGTCTGCSAGSYPFPLTGNATSTLTQFNGGLTAFASSTIGDGTQAGGLTISGSATTTGNSYFAGNVGIGSTTPYGLLSVNPNGISGPAFVIGSSTRSLFSVNSMGGISITSYDANLGLSLSVPNANGSAGLTINASNTLFNVTPNGINLSRTGTSNLSQLIVGGSNNVSGTTVTQNSAGFLVNTGISNGGGSGRWSAALINPTLTTAQNAGGGTYLLSAYEGTTASTSRGFYVTAGNLGNNTGIGSTSPSAKLAVHAQNGDLNTTLFAIGSSTASATTTLFSVSNTGSITGTDPANNYTGRISPTKGPVLSTATTTAWTASTTGAYIPRIAAPYTGTIKGARCDTDSFLGVEIDINGSPVTPRYFIASSTHGLVSITANNTFNAGDVISAKFGTSTTASATYGTCSLLTTETTETP